MPYTLPSLAKMGQVGYFFFGGGLGAGGLGAGGLGAGGFGAGGFLSAFFLNPFVIAAISSSIKFHIQTITPARIHAAYFCGAGGSAGFGVGSDGASTPNIFPRST